LDRYGRTLYLKKPFFVINDLALLSEFNLLFYTLNESPLIFVRNTKSGQLIAKHISHKNKPVFHLITPDLLLVSADTMKIQG
jgi:hypothetical protein